MPISTTDDPNRPQVVDQTNDNHPRPRRKGCKSTEIRASSLVVVLVCSVGTSLFGQPQPVPPQIGTIEVITHTVFDIPTEGLVTPYRIANDIHVQTRERVLRRELLFASGDALDAELLEQTERNLRALPFIRDARVEAMPVDDNEDGHPERVDLRVVTWDRWSLAPRVDLQQVDGRTIWEAGISETNLLGFGKEVSYSHRTNLDRTSDRFLYRDPQLAGSRFLLTASLANLSDGDTEYILLDRPYFSLSDEWAFSFRAGSFSRLAPLFESGTEVERLRHRGRWGDVEFGKAIRRKQTSAQRLHVAYRVREERVGGGGRDFGILEVGFRSVEHRFTKLTHVNRFEQAEDFNLGAQSYGTFGLSTGGLGGNPDRVLFTSAGHSRSFAFRPDHFVATGVGLSGRRARGRWLNALADVWLRYLRKSSRRQALVGKLAFRHGHNLDPEVQILLGAESGLRGYPVRQFVGTRSLLLSAEQRWFVADEIGQLVSLGVSAFIDSGFAWPEEQAVDLSDLKTAIGISLLLGSNRLSTRGGIRFDVGYAVNEVIDAGRWVVSAGSDVDF